MRPRHDSEGGEHPYLTTLKGSDISADALQIALRRFPHLLHIMAQTRAAKYHEPKSTTPFLLESLSLDCMAELGAFTLPRLRHLSLKEHSSPSALSEFITRSGCILESLELAAVPELDFDSGSSSSSDSDSSSESDLDSSTMSVAECLRAVPSVTDLTFDIGHAPRLLLDALSPPESLLPNLTALKISTWAKNIDFERLIAALAARAVTLVSFHLVLHDAHEPFAGEVITEAQFDRMCESAGISIACEFRGAYKLSTL